jgi:hypothetical protein
MRARSREINIFNMSLLDILCGALGAFCFMMLVLLPYYKPPAKEEDLRKQQADTDELVKQMERLKEAAKNSELAQQMSDLIQKLQEQIKQLQGQVNQFAAQNEQLKTENDDLTKKNQEQARSLEQRRPFLTLVSTNLRQPLDLYLQDDFVGADKRSNPPFNPMQQHHREFWPGDIAAWLNGVAGWLVRDSPPNIHYKVYVKLAAEPGARVATAIDGLVVGENAKWVLDLPQTTLTPERYWTFLGTLTGEAEAKVSFKPATPAEQDAEWTRLSKTIPPASPASPAQSVAPARPTATAISAEDRRALIEKLRQQRQQRQQQQEQRAPAAQSPVPSP